MTNNSPNRTPIIIFVITSLLAFAVLLSITRTPEVKPISSAEELSGIDFLKEPCRVYAEAGEIFPDCLYEPSDFADGKIPDGISKKPEYENYMTTRFLLPVHNGKYYRVQISNAAYASNVYIDGIIVAQCGKVADNPEDFEPTFYTRNVSFVAQSDTVEIIIQQANYNHIKHRVASIIIGETGAVEKLEKYPVIRLMILCSCFFLASLISFGMYICFPENKSFLALALLCLAAMVNRGTPSFASELFPEMSWYFEHKIEIISRLLIAVFFLMLCDVIFKGKINKYVKYLPYIAVVGCIFFFGSTRSMVYTKYNEIAIGIVFAGILPYSLNLLINVIKDRKNLTYPNKLIILGVFISLLFALCNAVEYIFNIDFPFVMADGIIVLALLNMIAMFYEFRDKKEALDKAELRESQLQERNEAAIRLENLRRDFYADMSHELKTPLTVVAGNSALAARQIRMNTADADTAERLEMVEKEAVRLGRMVDGIKEMNLEAESNQDKKEISIEVLLKSTAEFCTPLCGRNHNNITVRCPEDIRAVVNEDMIFHCLYNLIANATRHCSNNTIEIGCSQNDDKTELYVMDHGDGMSVETMNKAFERGFSGDKGSGIGLPLCRRIVEENGGEIAITETQGGGVTVTFTL